MAGRGTDIVLGGNVEKQVVVHRSRRSASRRREAAPHPEAARRMAGAARSGEGRGRPAHHRHRTSRIAPDRQPVARPCRPSGRPGFVALLPVAGRSAAAHLRRRPRARDHGSPEDAGRRSDRGGHRHAFDRSRRSARSKRATSTFASNCSNTTTSSNDQRKVIYQQRNELLEATDVAETDRRHAPGRDHRRRAHVRAGRKHRRAVGRAGTGRSAAQRMVARSRRSRR